MAFGKVNETHEGVAFKRYIGVAPVKVVAINPTMEQLNALGYRTTEPITYLSKTDDGVDQLKIDVVVKTVAEKCNGIEATFKVPFTLRKRYVKGATSGKYKIMDNYGRTAWATKEEIEAKQVPSYANGPANIDKDYSVLLEGEELLNLFARAYLGIPNVTKFVNGAPAGMIDNPADAEGKLENVKNYFTGNIDELKDTIALAPNNWIKILVGVRTTPDNKQYQTVFARDFVSGGSHNYTRLGKTLNENLAIGRYADSVFGDSAVGGVVISDIKEYEVNATAVTPNNAPMPVGTDGAGADDMPF